MSIGITDKFKPKNNGSFALMDAADVEMPDGTRLSDFKGGVTSVNGQTGDVNIEIPEAINGKDGKDGVSATHSWNGTVLTITSASGTSSADLKGAKGDKGDTGAQGEKGDKGDKGDTGDGATIDPTLSQAGQAADAKAVGDAFAQATSEIEGALAGLAATIPTVDPTLSNEGKAADAKAVGDLFAQATEEINGAMQTLAGAIPTEDSINALIDAKLGVIENGTY